MLFRFWQFLKLKNDSINRIPRIQEHILNRLDNDLKSVKINVGQLQAGLNNLKSSIDNLHEVEFQVFSQWGDDGIIQYLANKIHFPNRTFIEFGVENYQESNTRFLLLNNDWSGFVIDGSKENIDFVKNDPISWACDLHAHAEFITKENINALLKIPPFNSEIGILSIDIDGNDYWVWEAISTVSPVLVIAEFNSIFGKNTKWTIPYDPSFFRTSKHASNCYYGASLGALNFLAEKKGYTLVGCNSKGNNAYFIRNDKMVSAIRAKTVEEAYVESKFREAYVNGERISGRDRIKLLEGLEVYDIESSTIIKINPHFVQY